MYSVCKGIKIDAIAVGVPKNWKSLEEDYLSEKSEIDDKKLRRFIKLSGVRGRYVAGEHQTNSDLCYAAAEQILAEKRINREKVGVLVYVTQTSDYQQPATALILQYRLGLGEECIAFDINLGCSGFTYGLNVVASLMENSEAEYGLLLCGELCSRKIPPSKSDNMDDLLFGDAGSATLLTKDEKANDLNFLLKSNGSGYKAIIHPWGFYRNPELDKRGIGIMDGTEVYRFSTNEVPELISELMEKQGTTADDYSYIGLHQANMLIINQIADTLGFSPEKNLISISDYGNTSSASIPTALVNNLGGIDRGKVRVLLSGFGIGLSWSAVDCYIDTKDIFKLIETDEFFSDGFGKE